MTEMANDALRPPQVKVVQIAVDSKHTVFALDADGGVWRGQEMAVLEWKWKRVSDSMPGSLSPGRDGIPERK